MLTLFYDDHPLAPSLAAAGSTIFLAGPTSKGCRTQWRLDAIELLADRGFAGAAIIPEFRDRLFSEAAPIRFAGDQCPVPGMRPISYNILDWETSGIERATIVLFWMPFSITTENDPNSLPGFTTRAEVSRELARAPDRIVLGMPPSAFSGAHIRYHAHRCGVQIHDTLDMTVDAALASITSITDRSR